MATMLPLLLSFLCCITSLLAFLPLPLSQRREQSGSQLFSAAEETNKNEATDLRSCPFSAPFPRYRIDLTRLSAEGDPSFSSSLSSMLFGGMQRSGLKQKLEKKYGREGESFQWIDQQPSDEEQQRSSFMSKLKQQTGGGKDRDDAMENADTNGIAAFAILWKAVAQLTTASIQGNANQTAVIAFPDCDKRILLNWKELVDWIQETMPDYAPSTLKVGAEILEDGQVVRITATLSTVNDDEKAISQSDDVDISPKVVIDRTKAWVKRLLVDLQICPFTKSVTKSGQGLGDLGVPVARIAYHTSPDKNVYSLLADTWHAIDEMIIQAGPSGKDGISSILLAAPGWDDNWEAWSGPFFTLLEQCVVAARAEPHVGVVCFHPRYATPDGNSWPGFGHMHSVPRLEGWLKEEQKERGKQLRIEELKRQVRERIAGSDMDGDYSALNECPVATTAGLVSITSSEDIAAGGAWQRRTPHATINVLRANQLAIAESRRNTSQLYARNINTLMQIGNDRLFDDLESERQMS